MSIRATARGSAWPTITKNSAEFEVEPNLIDYEVACTAFSWEDVRHDLSGLPHGQGLNIAHQAVVRHARGERRDHLAIR